MQKECHAFRDPFDIDTSKCSGVDFCMQPIFSERLPSQARTCCDAQLHICYDAKHILLHEA
jgi:hypothetical protein